MEKMFYLKTIGAGTQNLIRIFLMLSCNVFSSRYQEVWSTADAPAVGSGAPHTEFMAEGWDPSNSSSNLKKNICNNIHNEGFSSYFIGILKDSLH